MFTGIVQKVGVVQEMRTLSDQVVELVLGPAFQSESDPIQLGESIAVNGVCLTVCRSNDQELVFNLAPETLRVTALSRLVPGRRVNLERAMRAQDRFSGHWVQGHVDGTATITRVETASNGCWDLEIDLPESFLKYVVEKGSFSLDGISLTVHKIQNQSLQFQIIPHTWAVTALSDLYRGEMVNFEVDLLAKIIERLQK